MLKPSQRSALLIILLAVCSTFTANSQSMSTPSPISIIPKPASINQLQGTFKLTKETAITLSSDDSQSQYAGRYLRDKLHAATGFNIPLSSGNKLRDRNIINLALASDTTGFGNSEGYHLNVSSGKVQIEAPTPHGLFNGVQTLLQLFPPQILQSDYTLVPQNTRWTAPAVSIKDYPRFPYRGMHLDVGRHFMSIQFVKKYIDMMAMYKMNRFHWHLTEDQGWRIQIKKYPKLTSIGAWRDSTVIGYNESGRFDHHRTGGFYTQAQIREVVKYAKERFVTIIPEIEMPGHSSAALAAYPELGCDPEANYHVKSTWGVKKDIYCPSEKTFHFLENVLTEVMDLFPSKYIHIGGDEAPKIAWKNSDLAQQVIKREGLQNEKDLQSYFITRIEKFLNAHNRNIIGWDEILEGGLAPNATVMSWRGTKGGIKAARQHHNVIMTPNDYCYLDFYQANPKMEPLAAYYTGNILPLKKVYAYEPVPKELTKKQSKYILGVQAGLWTEYIPSPRKAEYMAYPRALALAELGWSPKNKHNWNDFWNRLQPQFNRFDVLGINYGKHYKGNKTPLEDKR